MRADTMSHFAQTIINSKYAHTKPSGHKETWPEIAKRVAHSVMDPFMPDLANRVEKLIVERKFMPGGRYLYTAGRRYPQINNCFLGIIQDDSRECWADTMSFTTNALMTGGGLGHVYSKLRAEGELVGGMGGTSTGPCALMQMVNEAGRYIMQGGARRSALYASLHWWHPDVFKFIDLKNWSDDVKALKLKDFNFPATMDGTNISVILDDEFFEAYHNTSHDNHKHAHQVYNKVIYNMCKSGEPGFAIDVGENAGEAGRNAPVSAKTQVLTDKGYRSVGSVVGQEIVVWTGKQWAKTVFKKTGDNVPTVTVRMTGRREIVCDPSHPFILADGSRVPAKDLKPEMWLKTSLPAASFEAPAVSSQWYEAGFVMGDGHLTNKISTRYEVTVCTVSKEPCVARFSDRLRQGKCSRGYSRYYGKLVTRAFSKNELLDSVNQETPTNKAAFIAGWFDADGSYDKKYNRVRLSGSYEQLQQASRMLEELGILSSINLAGKSGYTGEQCWLLVVCTDYVNRFAEVIPTCRVTPVSCSAYRATKIKVKSVTPSAPEDVYCCDVGVEEHSFMAEGVIISNCTEVTTRDNGDMCNLASLNLARIESKEEFDEATYLGTAFLICGTLYSPLPMKFMYPIREKNRRLGLGLMGIHEWLLINEADGGYGPNSELCEWLEFYAKSTSYAHEHCDKLNISRSVKTRAIAPNGTIAIVAETIGGCEPIFALAQKRRYLSQNSSNTWKYQYIIDACAKRIIDAGIDPENIEDAYDLAEDYERRIGMQAWLQQFVDHAISSTINMPAWGSSINNENTVDKFGKTLIKYLPKLRGITVYPDGSRGGQPLNRVSYAEAIMHIGKEFIEGGEKVKVEEFGNERACVNGVCGL